MIKEITVKRNPPVNLKSEDSKLFDQSLETTFTRLFPLKLTKVWVLEDTIFELKGLRFYSSHTHIANLGFLQFARRIVYCVPKSWRKIPKAIWVTDEWSANYFHWMAECMPRIWEGLEISPDSPILIPESFKNLPYVTQSLDLLGLKAEFLKSTENLVVKSMTLTSRTSTFPNFQENLIVKTREKFSIQSPFSPGKKTYISRKFAPKRFAYNEDEVQNLLKKKGFDIVYAEHLSLHQQIQLMSETRVLVSLHGAALTNMIFLPPNAAVLELRNAGDAINQCFFNLASALGLAYFYTLNAGDQKDSITTNFTIDLKELERVVDSMG